MCTGWAGIATVIERIEGSCHERRDGPRAPGLGVTGPPLFLAVAFVEGATGPPTIWSACRSASSRSAICSMQVANFLVFGLLPSPPSAWARD
jgi:hypothetical protein